jgi:TonB family protein
MKKFYYLLSIAGHALLALVALNADFPITIIPRPARVITIEVAAPPLPYFATGPATRPTGNHRDLPAAQGGTGEKNSAAAAPGGIAGGSANGAGGLPFLAPLAFSLKEAPPGSFSLSPTNGRPTFPAGFNAAGGSPGLGKYSAAAYNPGVMMAGTTAASGVDLVPFDVKEKAVAAWTEAVLARIERNWFIPTSARLAFSGQVQITLIIEKNGSQQSLVMQDSSLPEALAQSALHAVKASLPLPPLPENIAGQTFVFNFIFIYNG